MCGRHADGYADIMLSCYGACKTWGVYLCLCVVCDSCKTAKETKAQSHNWFNQQLKGKGTTLSSLVQSAATNSKSEDAADELAADELAAAADELAAASVADNPPVW